MRDRIGIVMLDSVGSSIVDRLRCTRLKAADANREIASGTANGLFEFAQ